MTLVISQASTPDFKPIEAGTHTAVISAIVDFGTQTTEWKGVVKDRPQVRFTFSFPDMPLDDGRCMSIGRTYSASLHENSGLRAHLEGIRGRKFTDEELAGFDIAKAVGAPCLLNVIHETGEFGPRAKIASVMPLPKNFPKPNFTGPMLVFDLASPRDDVWELLPPWQQEIIEKSPEYKTWMEGPSKVMDPPEAGVPFDDDITF